MSAALRALGGRLASGARHATTVAKQAGAAIGKQVGHDLTSVPGFLLQGTAFALTGVLVDRLISQGAMTEPPAENSDVAYSEEELKALQAEIDAELKKVQSK